MFVLEGNIQIGDYIFRVIHDVEYTKSVDELVDTATIKLPKKFKVKQNDALLFTEQAIKIGAPVSITIGYERKYSATEFVGFVAKIKPKYPVEIVVEDAMWLLRRKNINKIWNTGVSLKDLLREIVKGTELALADNIPEMELDKFLIKNANGTQVLQKLKQDFGLSIFINDQNQLYCGLQQGTNIAQEVAFDLNYNIVENNLEYRKAEERKIKVRYAYIDQENKRKNVEVGDADGELRTYHTSVVSNEATSKEMATAEIEKLKYDGYDGTIKAFLMPFATRGMKAIISDTEYPEQNGNYFIKKVRVSFGQNGARRTVTLGMKL